MSKILGRKHYRLMIQVLVGIIFPLCLTHCVSQVWTGASLVYDRHNLYLKLNDFQLGASASRALYSDQRFKSPDCWIEVAVFNRDILLTGHVPSVALRNEAYRRVSQCPSTRRVFNQLELSARTQDAVVDSWITAKIRSQILANSAIDPHQFKVVTYGKIVYLMGDVIPSQARQVILYARQCSSVVRVVKLFKYYNLSDKPTS